MLQLFVVDLNMTAVCMYVGWNDGLIVVASMVVEYCRWWWLLKCSVVVGHLKCLFKATLSPVEYTKSFSQRYFWFMYYTHTHRRAYAYKHILVYFLFIFKNTTGESDNYEFCSPSDCDGAFEDLSSAAKSGNRVLGDMFFNLVSMSCRFFSHDFSISCDIPSSSFSNSSRISNNSSFLSLRIESIFL